jgi:lysozyme
MTESEKQQSKMSTKQQIQSDSKLPAEFQKKLEDNVSTRGGANLAGLTPEMKARLANAAAEYKQKTGKDFDVTSGYRSGTKQADIMMEKWNQGIGKQWYGHTFEKLGLAKNGKLNVSEEDAKKKLAEYYDKNKIGHASGEKIDVGKENLQMKMELLKKHGIKSTNIKNDEIDFIMDKNYKNVLDPNATPGEYEKKMAEQSNQPINNDEALKSMVKRHEGSRNKAYKDTEGYWTVGVGHKLGSDPALANTEWSNEQVDAAFTKDLSNAQDKASKIPEYANLNKARQNALTDMTFNMGQKGVMNFKNMRSALASGDYEGAANELLNSKYAKQTGGRAKEIAEIIRSGKMPGEVESEKSSSKSDELAGLEKQKEVEKSQLQAKQTAEATLKAQKDQKPVDKQDTKSVSAETMGGVPMNTDGIPAWIMNYHFENEGSTSIFKG